LAELGKARHEDFPGPFGPDIETVIVLTKADKLSQIERARQKKALAEIPLFSRKTFLFFSAVTGEGKDELWNLIKAHMG